MRYLKASTIRKLARVALYGFAAAVVAVTCSFGVMTSSWFHRLLERRLSTNLARLTGGQVEMVGLHFSPLSLRVSLREIVIHGTEPAGAPPLFAAHQVGIRVHPATFLRRRLRLRGVEWAQAEIRLRMDAEGATNFPGPLAAFRAGEALDELLNWSIRRLTLAHTTVFWNDERLPLELRGRDVTLLLRRRPARRYLGSLSSSAFALSMYDRSFPSVTLASEFSLSRGEVTVTSLAWRSDTFSGECAMNVRYIPTTTANLTVQTTGDAALFAAAVGIREVQGGRFDLHGQATYSQQQFAFQGKASAHQVHFRSSTFNVADVDFSATVTASPHRLELPNLNLKVLDGTVDGNAEVWLDEPSPRFSLRSSLHGLDAAAALRALRGKTALLSLLRPASKLSGTVTAAWRGPLKQLTSQFDLELRGDERGAPESVPLSGSLQGSLALTDGLQLELTKLELLTPRSSILAEGALGRPPSRLTINFNTTDFEEWRPLVESLASTTQPIPLVLKSAAAFSGSVSGPLDQVMVNGRLEMGAFEYGRQQWDRLMADVLMSATNLEVSSGRLQRSRSTLWLEAATTLESWKLTQGSRVRVAARTQNTPLEGLLAALAVDYPASGLVSGNLELEGISSRLRGSGAVWVQKGTWDGEPIDSFSLSLRVEESAWELQDLSLAKGSGHAHGWIQLRPGPRLFSFQLRGEGFALAGFKRLASASGGVGFDGRAEFEARGEGSFDDPRVQAALKVRQLEVGGTPVGDFEGQAEWHGRQMRLQGESVGLSGTVRFAGLVHTQGDWPLELTGDYANLRLDPWIRLLRAGTFDTPITLSGSFTLVGPLKNPARIELRSRAQTLQLLLPGFSSENVEPLSISYREQSLTVERFHLRGPATSLEVGGTTRLGKQPTLAFNLAGQIDAALLKLVDPALQTTGIVALQMRVAGTPPRPLYYGTAELRNVAFAHAASPLRVTALNGEIRVEGERASSRALRGLSGGGSIQLAGFFAWGERPRFELAAEVNQVRVRYPVGFASLLEGNLRLTGSPERALLAGELNLRQAFVGEGLEGLVRQSASKEAEGAPPAVVTSVFAARTQLKIMVVSVPPVRLETHNLHLVADVDVHLQGSLANPVQVGTVHLESGDAVFRGNRYLLRRGEIMMANPFRTEPILEVEAHTRIQRYDITLDISGPFDRLKVAYRSDPPLSTPDILTLLAVGYSRQEEEMLGAGSSQALPTVGASALLSEALSSQVTGRIQRLFGVSRIRIDPNVGGPGAGTGTRVTIEQQVTRGLTLTYVTNTAVPQQRIIQFEWELNNEVSLVGVRDQNGIFGLEFKLRRRFK